MMERPWVYHSTTPRSAVETPRVTMRLLTPMRATVLPLLSPISAPMMTAPRDGDDEREAEAGHEPGAQHLCQPGDRTHGEVEFTADERDHDGEGQDADDGLVPEHVRGCWPW